MMNGSGIPMHLADLLLELEHKQIELSVKGGALAYKAPPGAFAGTLVERVKCRKQDLIDLFRTELIEPSQQASDARESGEIPLTPWHGWYLETFNPEEHRWLVKRCVQLRGDARFDLIGKAVHLVMDRYDTFRQRLFRRRDGRWALRMLDTPGDPKLIFYDVTENTEERKGDIDKEAGHTLSIVDGPVICVALCKNRVTGDELAVYFHHNIVDAYSVDPVVADIVSVYEQLMADQAVDRHARPECSYAAYTDTLYRYMNGTMFLARSISYWSDVVEAAAPKIRVDFTGGMHVVSNSRTVRLFVGPDVFSSGNASLVNDALLIAAVAALADWSGNPRVTMDVEHHGRGGHVPGMDFLDVIGPTTFKFPMRLALEPDSLVSHKSFEAARRRIVDATQHGLGYGFLRYLHPDPQVRSRFQEMQRAQVFFNNRTTLFVRGEPGEEDDATPRRSSGVFGIESRGHPDLHDPYSHELLIECDRTRDGIEVSLIYSGKIHKDETIVELAETLLSKLQRTYVACV